MAVKLVEWVAAAALRTVPHELALANHRPSLAVELAEFGGASVARDVLQVCLTAFSLRAASLV